MTDQLKLPRQLARELTFCRPSTVITWEDANALGVVEVRENRHTGEERRWTSIHELVLLTSDGRLWRRLYEQGLTESQDSEGAFSGEGDEIPFDLCRRQVVEVSEYRVVRGR